MKRQWHKPGKMNNVGFTYFSSSELNFCCLSGDVKSSVPFGTGGKLEFASKSFDLHKILCLSSSVVSSLSLLVSSLISDASDDVDSLESEMVSIDGRLSESGGEIRGANDEDVLGGMGGGDCSVSSSLPVAISKFSNSLKV
jgi:hypothetical protein